MWDKIREEEQIRFWLDHLQYTVFYTIFHAHYSDQTSHYFVLKL